MNNFYIIANSNKKDCVWKTVEEVEGYLKRHGALCKVQQNDVKADSGRYTDRSQVPRETDCIITIGGDGTLIQAARDLAGRDIPLIGINRGHLGYLTQINSDQELWGMLDALLDGRYRIESRMMLDGRIVRKGRQVFRDIALNEIVISRKDILKPLHFA